MNRVLSDIREAQPAPAGRASKAALRRRLDALSAPDVAERMVDSLVGFVTAPIFRTLNLVVAVWWITAAAR